MASGKIHVDGSGASAVAVGQQGFADLGGSLAISTPGYADLFLDNDNNSVGYFKIYAGVAAESGTPLFMVTEQDGAKVFVNETLNTIMDYGITVHGGSSTFEILAFKKDGIAHGITTFAETDTFGTFQVYSNIIGGVKFIGYSETVVGLELLGRGGTEDSTAATTSIAEVIISAQKKSGSAAGSIGNTANICVMRNSTITRFIFKGDGTAKADVVWNTFAKHDDVELLAKVEGSFLQQMYQYREELALLDLMTSFHVENGEMRAMVNWTKMNMVMVGGIRQNRALINVVADRVTDNYEVMRSENKKLRERVALLEAA